MSLYLKHRPQTLDEIVGNAHIVQYLERAAQSIDRFPQSVLLHGPTGCGKTTIARIITKMLGADEAEIFELDSASFRGIDTARALRSQTRFHAVRGAARVWIIDEVHQMTRDAQNAMLKLLEDTPRGAYFILCTTDPTKLFKTLRDRCQSLEVKPLSDYQLRKLLSNIAKSEGSKLNKQVFENIYDAAQGSVRAAIQILEQTIARPPEEQLEASKAWSEQRAEVLELCRALIERAPWFEVRGILAGLKDYEPESVRRAVLGYAKSVLLRDANDQAAKIIEEFWEPLYDIGFPGLVFICYKIIN